MKALMKVSLREKLLVVGLAMVAGGLYWGSTLTTAVGLAIIFFFWALY